MIRDERARVLLHDAPMVIRTLTACTFLLACDQAPLIELPDANETDACTPHAALFCDAAASGCVGAVDASADSYAALLPTDAAFPVGCTANVVSAVRDSVSGQCKLGAVCTCFADDAGDASPAWSCTP